MNAESSSGKKRSFRSLLSFRTFKKNNMGGYITAFLLAFATAGIFIVSHWLLRGIFYIGSDYVHQQVPFLSHLNRIIKQGNVLWDDTLDLGTQFIGGYSYYAIGSPFFWLSLLFDSMSVPSVMPIMLMLKLGVAGLTSYAWLRTQTSTDGYAVIGSLLYSFCGFQIGNLNFYQFADVAALFPLLLLALDAIVLHNRRFVFAPVLAINALCSWFFFPGEVVFLALYYFVRLATGDYPKPKVGQLLTLAAESITGVTMTAVVLLPALLFMVDNPRAAGFTDISGALLMKPIHIAELIRGMLMPPECGFYRGFFLRGFFNGGELYLPLFGLVPAAAWVLNRRKSYESILIGICLVLMSVPLLNSAFVALNAEYYTRWFYMPTLVICLASVKALENRELPLKKGYLFYLALWCAFFLVFLWFRFYFKVDFVYNWVIVIVFSIISIGGFLLTLAARRVQRMRCGLILITSGVMCFAAVCGFYNIYLMQKCWDRQGEEPAAMYALPEILKLDAESTYFRIDATNELFYNEGTMTELPSISSFSSTIEPSIFDFYSLIGIPRTVISILPIDGYGYRAFLSVKYRVVYRQEEQPAPDSGWTPYETRIPFSILENEWYIPLGYCYDAYITEEDFMSLPDDIKHLVLVRALVLDDETALGYDGILTRVVDMSGTEHSDLAAAVESRRNSSAYASCKVNTGYIVNIDISCDNLVFLSIPWDSGWTAEVNGKPATIEKVDGGFIAVLCEAGDNTIKLSYLPRGLKAGAVLSASACMVLVIWAVFTKKQHPE